MKEKRIYETVFNKADSSNFSFRALFHRKMRPFLTRKLLLTLANYRKGIITSSGNSYLCSIRFKTKKLCIKTC